MTWRLLLLTIAVGSVVQISDARASTTSLSAQGIPTGLLRDPCSMSRFPSSAMDLDPGLTSDIEGGTPTVRNTLFRWGKARLGLDWSRESSRLRDHLEAAQCLVAVPWGPLRLGLVAGGWVEHHDDVDRTEQSDRAFSDEHVHQRAGLGVGFPLGRGGYLDVAVHLALHRTNSHEELWAKRYGNWELRYRLEESANTLLAHWTEARLSAAVGNETTLLALVGYRVAALSRDVQYEWQGGAEEAEDLRDKSQKVHASFALQRPALHSATVRVGLSLHYGDELETSLSGSTSSHLIVRTTRSYQTDLLAFAGVDLPLRRTVGLYAGVQGSFNRLIRAIDSEEQARADDYYELADAVSAGFWARFRELRLDAQINNSVSSQDPFARLSLSYRF